MEWIELKSYEECKYFPYNIYMLILVVGIIGTFISVSMYMPQTFLVVKDKKTGTLSRMTFLMIFFGCILWTIYSGVDRQDVVNNISAYLSNVVIVFLMLPILWYLFANSKNRILTFTLFIVLTIAALTFASIIMFDRKLILSGISNVTKDILDWFFVLTAGILVGIPFVPQMIKVIRDKEIGNVSILSTILIIISNVIWGFYWTYHAIFTDAPSDYVVLIVAIVAILIQIPILIIHIKNERKRKIVSSEVIS